jgi:hypothetical protein
MWSTLGAILVFFLLFCVDDVIELACALIAVGVETLNFLIDLILFGPWRRDRRRKKEQA